MTTKNSGSTGFTPIINDPRDDFMLAKDANDVVYVCSIGCCYGAGISAPYDVAMAMKCLFGFSFRDGKTAIIEVPMPSRLINWLSSQRIAMLVQSLAQ